MKVLFFGTADTKSASIDYFISQIYDRNDRNEIIFIDISCSKLSKTYFHLFDVIEENSKCLSVLSRGEATKLITDKLRLNLDKIITQYNPDIIVGMGGAGGTSILLEAIALNSRIFPPFILFSTVSLKIPRASFTKYTVIIPCITDLDLLSSYLKSEIINFTNIIKSFGDLFSNKNSLANAKNIPKKKYIITTLGSLHQSLMFLSSMLSSNIDLIPIHASGHTIETIELLKKKYLIDGVILLGTTEISNYFFEGDFSAKENLLDALNRIDLPVCFMPGGLEFIVTIGRTMDKGKFINRGYQWNNSTWLYELNEFAAEFLYSQLKAFFISFKNYKIILPLKSYSKLSEKEQPFSDSNFVKIFNDKLKNDIELNKYIVDVDINSMSFAQNLKYIVSL